MKKQFKHLLLLASLYAMDGSAQNNQDFYYLLDNKTQAITKVAGKYLVEYPNVTQQPQPAPGQKVGLTMYLVTDTSNLGSLPHYVTSTYSTNGEELNYARDIVLRFKPNIDSVTQASLITNFNLVLVEITQTYKMYKVNGDALQISKSIYQTGLVTFCHPDFITIVSPYYKVNDPFFNGQWYLHNWGQGTEDLKKTTPNADIDALEAWDITIGNPTTIIAVLDMGVTNDHPDLPLLRQVRLAGSNFGVGYDGTTDLNDPSPVVSTTVNNNHGDACAGIIAASHNTQGIAGIAPNCKIMPVKLPLRIPAASSVYVKAVEFAVSHGADIISISYGSNIPMPDEHVAINNAIGINKVVVMAAGNYADRQLGSDCCVGSPANIYNDNAIAVVASDRDNKVALYSPGGERLAVAAPSHSAYPSQKSGETFNIYSIDIPGKAYGANSWKTVMLPQLPFLGEVNPPSGFINHDAYTARFGGTSAAAPQVAGVVALMKAVNGCMGVSTIKDILQSTADKVGGYDYNYNPAKPGYSTELGYGKLNAFKAVKAAQALSTANQDLFIKDNISDLGVVGVNGTGGGDKSPDIWVRNQPDGLTNQVHENPEFTPGMPCYVYVRVRNKSCFLSVGRQLSLYWSKASTWASWPSNWNGSSPLIGNIINTKTIPDLQNGESAILEFTWNMIDPKVFKTWNSCLLARIESIPYDPITAYPSRLDLEVKENNSVAMRNLTIVDIKPGVMPYLGGRVLVGNINNTPRAFNIAFKVPNTSYTDRPIITNEAEVRLSFDSLGWNILETAGVLNQQGIQLLGNRELLLKNANISFNNLSFPADTRIPVDVSFNFLMDNKTNTSIYEYEMSQAFTDTPDMVLGTESFEIYKATRSTFNAYAGADTTINKGDSISLYASQINEAASYKWYDAQHNLLHSGSNFKISPASNKTYTLEVVSLADGFKDYDEVAVSVKQHFITSMSPNPASSQVTISYDASNASAASIMMLQANGTSYQTYTISPNQSSISINTSAYPTGIYTVVLVCDGQSIDAKSLQVN